MVLRRPRRRHRPARACRRSRARPAPCGSRSTTVRAPIRISSARPALTETTRISARQARSAASRGPLVGHPRRVVAREAGAADRRLRAAASPPACPRARGSASEVAPICSRISSTERCGGGELVLVGHVDPVEARRDDRRRRDAHVHLGRAGVEEHRDELAHRVAADDRVVDDHDPLARRPRRAG